MNAYIVDGGDVEILLDQVGTTRITDTMPSDRIVYANDAGQARALFISFWATHTEEWLERHYFDRDDPISVRLYMSSVDQPRGVAGSDDTNWLDYLVSRMGVM
jgi:hypothetical protein